MLPEFHTPTIKKGSLGIGGEVSRFWGVSGVYTPLTPQNLAFTTSNPKEPTIKKLMWKQWLLRNVILKHSMMLPGLNSLTFGLIMAANEIS